MSNSSTLAAMSLFGGAYSLDASTATDLGTVQTELEQVTSAMYTVSQRRLDYGLSIAIPNMTEQLKRDNSIAVMLIDAQPKYELFAAGISNVAATTAARAIADLRNALPSSRRLAFVRGAENVITKLAAATSMAMLVARGAAYEDWRNKRDIALGYLMGDIETATKLRSLSDDLTKVGVNGIVLGAKEIISEASHSLSMKQIEWERNKTSKAYSDAASSDRGGLLAKIAGGIYDGYTDARGRT